MVDVLDEDGTLKIVRAADDLTPGQRLVARMRGTATLKITTDEVML